MPCEQKFRKKTEKLVNTYFQNYVVSTLRWLFCLDNFIFMTDLQKRVFQSDKGELIHHIFNARAQKLAAPPCKMLPCNLGIGKRTALNKSLHVPHLAKRLSDLKQNGTQEKTPFSGTVFHNFSHGVLRFVASVSFKNYWIEAPWLAVKEFQPVRRWFFELTLATKQITPCERV